MNHATSAITFLNDLIEKALIWNASDIHFDPEKDHARIQLRIDGILKKEKDILKTVHADIIGRVKILASLRTDEHMMPQDGRFRVELDEKKYCDIRVSIVPSYFGESAVLRLLINNKSINTLADLGMCEDDQQKIRSILTKSSGMILSTGPTGSGKTTTLYTILKILNNSTRSIVTIEDPIEYSIPGIRQIQTHREKGLTFASGLRTIVRQDPDIIMIGEIRDTETAAIAIHAALSGHLLLSTLHTNDAATAIPRLINMGIEPYLIASTIGVIIGQRLVRRKSVDGYRGRIGLFEVLSYGDISHEVITHKTSAQTIKDMAIKNGMRTMESDGLEKIEKGLTSMEEVITAIIE